MKVTGWTTQKLSAWQKVPFASIGLCNEGDRKGCMKSGCCAVDGGGIADCHKVRITVTVEEAT